MTSWEDVGGQSVIWTSGYRATTHAPATDPDLSPFNRLEGEGEQELKVHKGHPLREQLQNVIPVPPNEKPSMLCGFLLQGEELFYLRSEVTLLKNSLRGRPLLVRTHAVL